MGNKDDTNHKYSFDGADSIKSAQSEKGYLVIKVSRNKPCAKAPKAARILAGVAAKWASSRISGT